MKERPLLFCLCLCFIFLITSYTRDGLILSTLLIEGTINGTQAN